MQCPNCKNSELVTKQTESAFSLGGILAALLFLVGAAVMLFSLIGGLLVMIVALLVGIVGKRKITRLVCPACSYFVQI